MRSHQTSQQRPLTMKRIITTLATGVLLFSVAACSNARTSADAPTDLEDTVENPGQNEETLEDASSEVRQDQLESDIRAREQRNEVFGDEEVRADSDLESEVRAKLEANIPRSKLTVAAEDGAVQIVGTVPGQGEYDTIELLAYEIQGVDSVEMDVEIVPGPETEEES